ncbi:MAG: methyltransferase domain-containing protein [Desulfobulbaceae bacterium]|nr:MAG: methyltransferase domain-containing protein [Desulfobulbaceae bacterium]
MSTTQQINSYQDIDWPQLWQNSRAQKSWKSKTAGDWSKKAPGFASRNRTSAYVDQFLQLFGTHHDARVLDVGCGPGTLSIPLAQSVGSVTAVDYAAGMIEELDSVCNQLNIANIKSVCCAWEDHWPDYGITPHDIAIASRSMNIAQLERGIEKLIAHATEMVIISDRIDPSPFDPDAFQAIGRSFQSGPDYIYTFNILYTMGIHPRVEHITLDQELTFTDLKEAYESYRWMFKDLSDQEQNALQQFIEERVISRSDNHVTIKRNHPQRWAVMSWKT